MANAEVVDRNLAIARELRVTVQETRQALQVAHDLVERSRRQTQALVEPDNEHAVGAEYGTPSELLVECLIEAYELAADEGEPQTHALLSQVLMHVGRRIARSIGPNTAKIIVH